MNYILVGCPWYKLPLLFFSTTFSGNLIYQLMLLWINNFNNANNFMPQLIQRDAVASSPSFSRPAARAPRRACSQVIYILTLSSWLLRRRRPSLKVLISRSVSSFIRSSTRWSFDGNLKIKFYWMKSFIRLNFYFTSVFTPFNSSNRSQRKLLLESTKI